MRVALVTQLFAPEFEGGTERVVRVQAEVLRAAGHEVSVLCGSARAHAGRDVERSRVGDIPVARLPRLERERLDLACDWPRLVALARLEVRGCDAVWVHHWATLGGGLVRGLARDLPVTLWLHDAFAACPRFFRAPPRAELACPSGSELGACVECLTPELAAADGRALAAGLARRQASYRGELLAARRVVAPSGALARRLQAALDLRALEITVLPHAAWMPPRSAPRPRGGDWDGSRPLRLMHCGHLSRAKGILDLVRALDSLPAGTVELDLAGGLLEADLPERAGQLAPGLGLRWRGPYDGGRLAELAAQADLALLPSRLEESYGLVLDELCDLGLPVWVSDRGALPERLEARGGAGRVLPAADPQAWAQALRGLLGDPGQLARERARLRARQPGAQALRALLEPPASPRRVRA